MTTAVLTRTTTTLLLLAGAVLALSPLAFASVPVIWFGLRLLGRDGGAVAVQLCHSHVRWSMGLLVPLLVARALVNPASPFLVAVALLQLALIVLQLIYVGRGLLRRFEGVPF